MQRSATHMSGPADGVYYRFLPQTRKGFTFKSDVGGYADAITWVPRERWGRAKINDGEWFDTPTIAVRSVARWDLDGEHELSDVELGERATAEFYAQDHWWPADRERIIAGLWPVGIVG